MNSQVTRSPRRPVHGVLVIDKPIGWTSQDALTKVKNLLRAEKGGHTGTLDPLATGVLPLCFGAATKFAQVSLDADKAYLAVVHLGETRVGGDREGEVLSSQPVSVTAEQFDEACRRFVGDIEQVPPMQSALKHQGKPLYEWARQGVTVDRPARQVRIHAIERRAGEGHLWTIHVRCSKGTYIRSLAMDIGEALGVGAHLASLQRTQAGDLGESSAVSMDELLAMDEVSRAGRLLPPDVLLGQWPEIRLNEADAGAFLAGMRRRVTAADAPQVRVYGPQERAFLGAARIVQGELIPVRLLSPLEVQSLLDASKSANPSLLPRD